MRIFLQNFLIGFSAIGSAQLLGGSTNQAYTNVDAMEDLGPNSSGISLLHKLTSTQSRVLRSISYSAETKKVYELANDTVRELDFDQLLDSSYATKMKDGSFVFPFRSSMESGQYKVNFVRKPIHDQKVNNFLDSSFQFGVKENPSIKTDPERGYGVTSEGVLVVDEFDHHFMGRLGKNHLMVLDPSNLRSLKAKNSDVFSGVTGLARNYINDLAKTLPVSLDLIDSLVDPEITFQPVTEENIEQLDVLVRLKLDIQSLKQKHRHLGEHIERMMEDLSFVSSSTLKTSDNLVLISGMFNLAENKLEIRFRTARGLLVPVTNDDESVLTRGIDLAKISNFSGKIITNFRAKVYGLTIENKGIESSLEYQDGETAVLKSKLLDVPGAKFSGGLFGFLPPDFLNLMMPGSLEGYAKIFSDGLLHGNGGKGAFAEIRFDSSVEAQSTMRWRITGELKDDFFLTFGLRVLNDYLWPSDETLADMQGLSAQVAACLDKDIQKLNAIRSADESKAVVSH
jgi:hypothetical protein